MCVCVSVLECMCLILIDFHYRRLDFQCILLTCLDLMDNNMTDHACLLWHDLFVPVVEYYDMRCIHVYKRYCR